MQEVLAYMGNEVKFLENGIQGMYNVHMFIHLHMFSYLHVYVYML